MITKTKNIILGAVLALSLLTSCSATFESSSSRSYPRRVVVVDRDLPNVPNLTGRQVAQIRQIRAEERRNVVALQRERERILFDIRNTERSPYGNNRAWRHLQRQLSRVESQINNEHKKADKRVWSVLTRDQRRFLYR
ncbi:MAG: hypothetical protein QM654_07250 [Dysgonamonadaceae bacterium]